jgi:TolB-like protein
LGSKPSPGTSGPLEPQLRADDASNRLNSWKEIAVYLSRDVRTVQRWEKREELPVHRHLHEKAGSVYAFKSEIDRWWSNRRPALESEPDPEPVPGEVLDEYEEIEFDAGRRPSVVTDGWYRFKRKIYIAALTLAVVAVAIIATRWFLVTKKQVAIMVVPFSNLNVDPYFSAGMTEELMRQLGEMDPKRIRVIALPLAALDKLPKDPENVARDLKPDYILRGSVQRASERVRITAQLIRVDDHTQVFDESYEGELQDALKVQAEVAQTIAARINLTVSPTLRSEAQPVNPAAHDAYLQGMYAMEPRTPTSIYSALSHFEQAITIEPEYAEAYAGIADCYTLLGSVETGALPPRDAMPRAKRAALKALELNPNLAQTHASLAHIALVFDWNLENAHREFQKAVELNPSYALAHQWYGLYWNAIGDTEHAVAEIRQAQELDPLSPATRTAMAEAYYFGHDYPKAIEESKAALEVNPNFILGYLNLGRALEQSGQLPEAVEAFEHGRELSHHGPGMTMFLSHALALQRKRDRANELYAGLERFAATGARGIDNLPINGRNYINFRLTGSGPGPSIGAAPTSGVNFGGQRAGRGMVNVDGVDAKDHGAVAIGKLRLSLLGPDHKPVLGARVEFTGLNGSDGVAFTDAHGELHTNAIEVGKYHFKIEAPGLATGFVDFQVTPENPVDLTMVLKPGPSPEFLIRPDSTGHYVPALYLAAVQGGLGNKDEAFRLLEKAYDERCEYLIYMDREPMADFLRSDPRFEPFLKKIGLR